eukprot:m.19442 g.19442  ORF g.19442 m.19442 type:complete len:112 (-) comp11829_c0_seq2:852-1187(-)
MPATRVFPMRGRTLAKFLPSFLGCRIGDTSELQLSAARWVGREPTTGCKRNLLLGGNRWKPGKVPVQLKQREPLLPMLQRFTYTTIAKRDMGARGAGPVVYWLDVNISVSD